MTVKVLFFDTSALLKNFVDEQGTQNVQWLTSFDTKVTNSLHFVTNKQVCEEFENKVRQFAYYGRITTAKATNILYRFDRHYKDKYFRVIGQSTISNQKADIDIKVVNKHLNLQPGVDDWDGLIYQSIVNALAWLGGESRPILVTCDKSFGSKVKALGYRVLDPRTQSINAILGVLHS